MKYPDDYLNKIICSDCLDVLREIPDKSIDLVLTDPPYGKKWTRGLNGIGILKDQNENDNLKWDKVPSKEYFDEILRVGKKVIIWGGGTILLIFFIQLIVG